MQKERDGAWDWGEALIYFSEKYILKHTTYVCVCGGEMKGESFILFAHLCVVWLLAKNMNYFYSLEEQSVTFFWKWGELGC